MRSESRAVGGEAEEEDDDDDPTERLGAATEIDEAPPAEEVVVVVEEEEEEEVEVEVVEVAARALLDVRAALTNVQRRAESTYAYERRSMRRWGTQQPGAAFIASSAVASTRAIRLAISAELRASTQKT